MMDTLLGRAQWWLQGHPNKRRPWVAVALGNLISDLRFLVWSRRKGGAG